MAKISIKSIFTGLAAAVFMAIAAVVSPVSALEGERNVQISPPMQKIALQPGEVYHGTFKVSNIGFNDFNYTLSSIPYSVTNDNYDPDFVTETTYNQLAKWVTFEKDSGHVDSNGIQEVHYTVTVPEDVPAGGQYAGLAVSVNNGEQGGMQTVTRVVMKLYAAIAGETREEGEILENKVTSFVFGGGKISATSLLKNTGNVHADAKYILKVYPLGSDDEIYSNEDQPLERTVLPETQRYNTLTWEETPSLGLYTVEQTIEYMGQTSTTKKFVIVCPLWLIVIFTALIFAIIFTLASRARTRKQEAKESKEGK